MTVWSHGLRPLRSCSEDEAATVGKTRSRALRRSIIRHHGTLEATAKERSNPTTCRSEHNDRVSYPLLGSSIQISGAWGAEESRYYTEWLTQLVIVIHTVSLAVELSDACFRHVEGGYYETVRTVSARRVPDGAGSATPYITAQSAGRGTSNSSWTHRFGHPTTISRGMSDGIHDCGYTVINIPPSDRNMLHKHHSLRCR